MPDDEPKTQLETNKGGTGGSRQQELVQVLLIRIQAARRLVVAANKP